MIVLYIFLRKERLYYIYLLQHFMALPGNPPTLGISTSYNILFITKSLHKTNKNGYDWNNITKSVVYRRNIKKIHPFPCLQCILSKEVNVGCRRDYFLQMLCMDDSKLVGWCFWVRDGVLFFLSDSSRMWRIQLR